jgi:hypothetical protein
MERMQILLRLENILYKDRITNWVTMDFRHDERIISLSHENELGGQIFHFLALELSRLS